MGALLRAVTYGRRFENVGVLLLVMVRTGGCEALPLDGILDEI